MPIYDYHCHLSPQEIAEDKAYENITQIWLHGDHYKWRAMRSFGITEDYITGNRSDKEKFMAFAKMIPYAIGNPLYHWCHLELQRYFDIDDLLSEATAEKIWEKANDRIQSAGFSSRKLIEKSNVAVICTTDDPIDDLRYHLELKTDDSFSTKVLPTFRPDKSVNIERDTFLPWLAELEKAVGYEVKDIKELMKALEERLEFFHEVGCRLSDHGMDTVEYRSFDSEEAWEAAYAKADEVLGRRLRGEAYDDEGVEIYKSVLQRFFGKGYAKRGWVMQLHIGALRNNSKRMYRQLGADIGFDSIDDSIFAAKLSSFMGDLDDTDELPKTILYTLNPVFNYVLGTMIGNFQGGGMRGKSSSDPDGGSTTRRTGWKNR